MASLRTSKRVPVYTAGGRPPRRAGHRVVGQSVRIPERRSAGMPAAEAPFIPMRFRLTGLFPQPLLIDAETADELTTALDELLTAVQSPRRRDAATLHLWHGDAWWNLTDDLTHFADWLQAMPGTDPVAVRHFVEAPLDRPDWLFLAAAQMRRLLDAAADAAPKERDTPSLVL